MRRTKLLAAALFFVLTAIFIYPAIYGLLLLPLDLLVSNYGPWHMAGQILLKNPYMQDAILQYFPWHHLVFESLTNGIIPFWNPYQNLGMPFMASAKPMVFYPFSLLFVFGEINAWNLSVFLQLFLSMVFMYALARDFKISRLPSILSAISFSLCSLLVGFLEFISDPNAIIWFPLFVLFAKRFIDKGDKKNLFFLGITISLSVFAGHLQYTAYGLILSGLFVLYYGRFKKIKVQKMALIFVSFILGILIASMQFLPVLELFKNSFRGLGDSYPVFSADLISPNKLFRLFSPDFFGNPTERNLTIGYIESSGYFGIIPFFFALYAIIFAFKNKTVRFFSIFFITAGIFAMKGPAQLLYLLKIPIITSGSGGRIFGLVLFCGALLAGFGLEEFLKSTAKRNILSIFGFGLFFALGILINYKRPLFFHDIQFQILILGIFTALSLVFVYLKPKSFKKIFIAAIIFLTFIDLFRMGYRYLTFSNKRFLYPANQITDYIKQNQKQSLARAFGVTEPDIETYFGFYSNETYNPLYIQRNGQLLQALQNLPEDKLPVNKYFLTQSTNDLKFALDFTGTQFIGVPKDSSPTSSYFPNSEFQGSFTKALTSPTLDLFINKDALPRFGLFYKYQVASGKEELKIISERKFDPTKEVLLEEKLPVNLEEGTGSADLVRSNVNSQTFEVKTDKPAIFYISDTYFPGWSATVNGKQTKIYRADYNLRAVLTPAGRSTINFSYVPSHFSLYVALSLISLGVLVILGFL